MAGDGAPDTALNLSDPPGNLGAMTTTTPATTTGTQLCSCHKNYGTTHGVCVICRLKKQP